MRKPFAIRAVLKAHTLQARGIDLIDEAIVARVQCTILTPCSCDGSKPMAACRIKDFHACFSKSQHLWLGDSGPILSLQKPPIFPTRFSVPPRSHFHFSTSFFPPRLPFSFPSSISLPSSTSLVCGPMRKATQIAKYRTAIARMKTSPEHRPTFLYW